jgi:hypothetical protein
MGPSLASPGTDAATCRSVHIDVHARGEALDERPTAAATGTRGRTGKRRITQRVGPGWRRGEGLARRLFPHSRRCSYLGTWQVASRVRVRQTLAVQPAERSTRAAKQSCAGARGMMLVVAHTSSLSYRYRYLMQTAQTTTVDDLRVSTA